MHKLAQLKQIKFLVKTDQNYTYPWKCTESHLFCTSLWSSGLLCPVTWWNVNVCYNQLQKCWGTPTKKWPFLLQIVPSQRSVSYNTDLPPIQTCSSKFWAWSCIASNFVKGWRGDHKHKIMDRPFMTKYGTVSQVLVVAVLR